jgi:hypothetical protein
MKREVFALIVILVLGSAVLAARQLQEYQGCTVTIVPSVSGGLGITIVCPGGTPPPTPDPVYGSVDPTDTELLGTCSAEVHDAYIVAGGDGYRYRIWHPRVDPSGCTFGHEHGEDPATQQDAMIREAPLLFGQIGRKAALIDPMIHEEPHVGFKVTVFNVGDLNSENRTNRMHATYLVHTGSGSPARGFIRFHSAVVRLFHPEFPTMRVSTQLMMDTGVLGDGACDPRTPAPARDIPRLDWNTINPQCANNLDMYEIWNGMNGIVRNAAGVNVYQSFSIPAVRDPITVINPANPTEVVYAWDLRVMALLKFKNSQTHFRGCSREFYNQFGYARNAGGLPQYTTDPFGFVVAADHPAALVQDVPVAQQLGLPVNSNGSGAWKDDQRVCGPTPLGLKN